MKAGSGAARRVGTRRRSAAAALLLRTSDRTGRHAAPPVPCLPPHSPARQFAQLRTYGEYLTVPRLAYGSFREALADGLSHRAAADLVHEWAPIYREAKGGGDETGGGRFGGGGGGA